LTRLTFWDRHNEADRLDISIAEQEAKDAKQAAKDGTTNPAYTGSHADIADSTDVTMQMGKKHDNTAAVSYHTSMYSLFN
jgi:hypothetical protein